MESQQTLTVEPIERILQANEHPSLEELRSIPALADLSEEGLQWMSSVMVVAELDAGEVLFQPGSPGDYLSVIFTGQIRAEGEEGRVYLGRKGQVTGFLPYSRFTNYQLAVRAAVPSRGALLHKRHFPELFERIPELRERLIHALIDRVRETARVDQHHEKLVSLGRLSAGLAHELGNPAASARRASDGLRQAVRALRSANLSIEQRGLEADPRKFLAQLECSWSQNSNGKRALDALERSEREDELVAWFDEHNLPDSWNTADALVDAGCTIQTLNEVAEHVPAEILGNVLNKLAGSFNVTRLIDEIDNSICRVVDLVRAIKEYTYMDQMPEQEIDLHSGLENTLIMLGYRLKHGFKVVREFDPAMPRVTARGSELNQVWTNLITNALDAMGEKGTLTIRTTKEQRYACVEIGDTGPGIPPEVQSQIFDPFFTTKPSGHGTGLGLDTAFRIITLHRGKITFESEPGDTRFTVRIPLPTH